MLPRTAGDASRPRLVLSSLTLGVIAAVAATCLTAALTASSVSAQPTATVPRNVIVSLRVVKSYFPDITKQASTGTNSSVIGNARATRSVIYTNGDGSKKVTLSVDQYPRATDASSAYQQAVQGSQAAPGFTPLPSPNLGGPAFAGISRAGAESHVGVGTLSGRLIVNDTIAGYDTSPKTVNKVVALLRKEVAAAKAALGTRGSR